MPAEDAIRMDNLVPTPYGCSTRKGYRLHASGLGTNVNTIVGNVSATGGVTLFAAADDVVWNVTNPAAPVTVVTGASSSYWQHVNFANSAGTHLVLFNGNDSPVHYNSTSGVNRLIAGDGTDPYTWSGIDPSRIIQGVVHQRRIWGVEKDSTMGWFLPPDSIYGVANFFDFGPHFKRGGYLVALGTWSADMGAGSDDQLVAISSEGEAAVFGGIDVANAATWALRGVYYVGAPPAGRRFLGNIAGDLLIITRVGIVSMATVLTSTTVSVTSNTTYSKKIQFLLNDLLSSVAQFPGWELQFFPTQNLLYINVPSIYSGGNGQLVSNYVNTSWCTFSGMNALCWALVDDVQYFGAPDGKIYIGWSGYRDDQNADGTGGRDIVAACQQAYTTFGASAAQKQVGLYRPTFVSVEPIANYTQLTYDYRPTNEVIPSAVPEQAGSYWNAAIWDAALWGGGLQTWLDWRTSPGIGQAVSLTLVLSSDREINWISTDYTYKTGGPL
ncbi:MAG: hypothetical protein E6Q97_17885 [Desulfurellales bacterium]|nr:MAG: hypothetical protein E6Q97_17885 [Desulfurellales bacterium]